MPITGATRIDVKKGSGKSNKAIAVTENPVGTAVLTPQFAMPVPLGPALVEGADGRFADVAHVHTADASIVTFNPNDLTDWTGAAEPGDVNDALDQLAGRVKGTEGLIVDRHSILSTVHTDVNTTVPPAEGDVLTYSGSMWKAAGATGKFKLFVSLGESGTAEVFGPT